MILGFIEHDRGTLNKASLEMLTLARRLGSVEAVVIGRKGATITHELKQYGISKVHLVVHDQLDDYAPTAWAKSLTQLATSLQVEAILASGSERGNEVMAQAAAIMNLPLATNCVDVVLRESDYIVTRLRWGGSLVEEARLSGKPKLLSVAQHVFAAEETLSEDLVIVEQEVDLNDKDFRVRVTERVENESEGVSLTTARVIVSGGRGVGSSEGFDKLEELAQLIDGAVGCSRVVTNKGWRPHSDQVGQTGTRVAPDLYIACGISGAIQHWVGCKAAKKILVINTDAEAPIVQKADYVVIADLHEIVPAIIAAIRAL
ncbi:MAG: electron transfer flavoprotein subunit alpha [Cyclobacteriaceae bacterium]|nr:MAG: electron transfer flavoprotein subunit alpha [Cyclobacteriaceae bacterium]